MQNSAHNFSKKNEHNFASRNAQNRGVPESVLRVKFEASKRSAQNPQIRGSGLAANPAQFDPSREGVKPSSREGSNRAAREGSN